MELQKVSCRLWLDDIEAAWNEAKGRSSGLPLFCVSYSTGALLCMSAVGRGMISFKRMYLLAPPIALQPAAKFLPLLLPFSLLGVSLPSLSPKDIRLHSWTPLNAYKAMFQARKTLFKKAAIQKLSSVPSRITIDPRDEFVAIDGLRCWQHDMLLENWDIEALHSEGESGKFRRHLLISPQRMGRAWNHMVDDIAHFLGRK